MELSYASDRANPRSQGIEGYMKTWDISRMPINTRFVQTIKM
jgi:hypothetical protein